MHVLNRCGILWFLHTIDIHPYICDASFDTKRYTVHRFIMAAYYGVRRTHLCASISQFQEELSVDQKKGLPTRKAIARGNSGFLCTSATLSADVPQVWPTENSLVS